MIFYLLQMIACSAAFYGLYYFLFQKEKMLVFNRFYLLGSLIASFFIPLITFTVKAPATQVPLIVTNYRVEEIQQPQLNDPDIGFKEYLLYATIALSILISVFLMIRFIISLIRIRNRATQNESTILNNCKVVLLKNKLEPHSFFNTIFISKNEYEKNGIANEILIHEMAHINQKHTWDLIFVELLYIFTWFNPMIYLYKRSIKTNHEFLADEVVVQLTNDSLKYQYLLLNCIYVNNHIPLASSFYFITKKRLIMLQKTFKKQRAAILSTTLIPLTAILLFSFSQRKYITIDDRINKGEITKKMNDTVPSKIEVVEFTPPKIVKDDEIQQVVTPPRIVKKSPTKQAKRFTPPKVRKNPPPPPPKIEVVEFTPPKVVKDDEIQQVITPPRIVKKSPTKQAKRFTPPKVRKDPPPPPPKIEVVEFTPPKVVKDDRVKQVKRFSPPKIAKDTPPPPPPPTKNK